MEQKPQAGWEFRQLRLWEQQLRESGTPAHSREDEDQVVRLATPPEAVEGKHFNAKARQSAEGVHHQEATRNLSGQEQQENAGLLSSGPKPDVKNNMRHNSKKSERNERHGFGDGKMWRQNLFNKYADHWNRVHEGKSMEISYSDTVAGNSTIIEELEEYFASNGEGHGSHVEMASRKKESEQQYLKALRQRATSITAKQEERSAGPQVQKKVEDRKPEGEKKNRRKAMEGSRDHGPNRITTFGRQGCQKLSPDSRHLLETGGAGEQKILEDAKMKEGPDKRPAGTAEDLKRIDIKPSDRQPNEGRSNSNWPDFPRKQALTGSARFQGSVIQDGGPEGGVIIFKECKNSKQLEGLKPTNNRAGARSRNVPFNERGSAERIQRARSKFENGDDTTIGEHELSKKSEGLESKGSERCRESTNSRPGRKESKRRTNGSQGLCEAQDPKGYKSLITRKGGKDSLQSESGWQDKDGKGRRQQQSWGQVDWTACDNNKRLIAAAAPWLQQEKPRNAARAIKETKLPFLQARYRTIYRVKDSHCEEVRWEDHACDGTTATAERTQKYRSLIN